MVMGTAETNPDRGKVIVCLGGGLTRESAPSRKMEARLEEAVRLYRAGAYEAIIATSKGTYRDPDSHPVTEAEVGERYLVAHGVPADAIKREDESMDTLGNAYFSRVRHLDPQRWYRPTIISNEFHIDLVEFLFRKVLSAAYDPTFVAVENAGISDTELRKWRSHQQVMRAFYAGVLGNVESGDLEPIREYLFSAPPYFGSTDPRHQELTKIAQAIWEK